MNYIGVLSRIEISKPFQRNCLLQAGSVIHRLMMTITLEKNLVAKQIPSISLCRLKSRWAEFVVSITDDIFYLYTYIRSLFFVAMY